MALQILLSELAQPEFKGSGMGIAHGPGLGPQGHGEKGMAVKHNTKLLQRLSSLRGPLLGGIAQGSGQGVGKGKGAIGGVGAFSGIKNTRSSFNGPTTTTGNTGSVRGNGSFGGGGGGGGVQSGTHSSSASAAFSSNYNQEPFRNLTPHEPSSSSTSWHNEPAVTDLDLSLSMISEGGEDEHGRHPQRPIPSNQSDNRQPRPPSSSPPGHVATRSSRQRGSSHHMSTPAPLSPPTLSRQSSGGSVGGGSVHGGSTSASRRGSEILRSPGILLVNRSLL